MVYNPFASGNPNIVPAYVPAQYQSWVSTASAMTGIPTNVVAAQINLESGFNPNAQSGAGAEGIAQFLPSTYASYGPANTTPFSASGSLTAYINFMGSLLQRFHGNLTDALAAYNAGPGNIGAGMGYANTILGNANSNVTASTSNIATVSTSSQVSGQVPSGTVGKILLELDSLMNPSVSALSIINPLTTLSSTAKLAVGFGTRALFAVGFAVVAYLGYKSTFGGGSSSSPGGDDVSRRLIRVQELDERNRRNVIANRRLEQRERERDERQEALRIRAQEANTRTVRTSNDFRK